MDDLPFRYRDKIKNAFRGFMMCFFFPFKTDEKDDDVLSSVGRVRKK